MTEPIHVPPIGEPELERKLTDGEIDMFISGLKIANQPASKQLARRLRDYMELREDVPNAK